MKLLAFSSMLVAELFWNKSVTSLFKKKTGSVSYFKWFRSFLIGHPIIVLGTITSCFIKSVIWL